MFSVLCFFRSALTIDLSLNPSKPTRRKSEFSFLTTKSFPEFNKKDAARTLIQRVTKDV